MSTEPSEEPAAAQGVAAQAAGATGPPELTDAWLVVVDPQRIFADPASEWASPMFDDAVQRIGTLAATVGPERTLVTRWVPGGREGSWRAYFERWPFADRPARDPFFDLVGPAEGLTAHPTLDVTTFGKWPALAEATGATPTLVLTGVSTDCCVISTALPAADAGASVLVPADACAGSDGPSHEAALHVMGLYAPQIVVTTTAAVRAALRP